jgi:predicted DNA-binding protein (MmcQ/YjbR family)
MTYKEVIKFCMALEGVSRKVLGEQGNAFALTVADSIFAYFETGAPIQWRLSLQVTAQNYDRLHFPPKTIQDKNRPGGNWLTIVRVESFDEQLLVELITWSYQQALLEISESP